MRFQKGHKFGRGGARAVQRETDKRLKRHRWTLAWVRRIAQKDLGGKITETQAGMLWRAGEAAYELQHVVMGEKARQVRRSYVDQAVWRVLNWPVETSPDGHRTVRRSRSPLAR